MKLTATVSYPCGAQFWIINGPDNRAELERLAHEYARWIGRTISSLEPTTGKDIANLEADRPSLSRSQSMWVEIRL